MALTPRLTTLLYTASTTSITDITMHAHTATCSTGAISPARTATHAPYTSAAAVDVPSRMPMSQDTAPWKSSGAPAAERSRTKPTGGGRSRAGHVKSRSCSAAVRARRVGEREIEWVGEANVCTGERAAEVDGADGHGDRDGGGDSEDEEEGPADFPSLHWVVQWLRVADGRGGGADPRGEPRTTARCARCHWGFS